MTRAKGEVMVLRTYRLSPAQIAWIEDEAALVGVTPSELLRITIDKKIKERAKAAR